MATIPHTPPEARQLRQRLLDALEVRIEPVPVSGTYKFGLCVVAAAMLTLPLIYFGLLFLFTAGVAWHAAAHHGWLTSRTMPLLMAAPLYVVPLVAGPTLALFLLKPFFARRTWHQQPQRLKREAEPFLYEYVARICAAVGAPVPRSIRVTCEVNAAAGFRRGVFLHGDDFALNIGLPLVAGMSLRQFTGVLAHEFGHFSQGTVLRMTHVIDAVNSWFARVAYERDSWDDWLEFHSHHAGLWLRPVFYGLRSCVWLNRWLMWGIMMLGHVISCYVARQQEFDADRYMCRLVGSDTVGPSLRRSVAVSAAFDAAIADLRQFWDEGRLADNLPRLIVAHLDQMSPALRRQLRRRARAEQTGLFDTHPSDRDRVASAREENDAGVFQLPADDQNLPASALFANFDRLARIVTLQFYRENIHQKIQPVQLHPVEALIERQRAEMEAGQALRRYFQTRIPALRPLPLSDDAGHRPADPPKVIKELSEARRRMLDELPEYRQASAQFKTAESNLFDATGALALLQADLRLRPGEFGLTRGSRKAVAAKSKQARSALEALGARLLPFEEHAGRRLSAALQLLQLARVQKRMADGDAVQGEVAALLPEALFVSGLMAGLPAVRLRLHGVLVLFSNLSGNEQNPALREAMIANLQALRTRLDALHDMLGTQLYPLDHAKADMTLREYALPYVPDEHDVGETVQITEQMFEKLVSIQMRLFARLALAAEKVETALGLPPLPDPEATQDDSTDRKRRPTGEPGDER